MTSHVVDPMTSKSSSSSKEPDSRILRGYCGVKELSNPNPLYFEPKAHAKGKETPENEQRKSKLLRDIAKDNPILSQPRS